MQTILVPTDYSATSKNAALYALQFAEDVKASRVLFYHSYELPISVDPMMPTLQILSLDDVKKVSQTGMDNFITNLKETYSTTIPMASVCEFNSLAEGIQDIADRENVQLIIMGITGGGKVEEVLVGSNTTSVAKHTNVPVLIIPAECRYTPVEEVMLACDFKQVVETTPIQPIADLLEMTKAKLFVLNVSSEKDPLPEDANYEGLMLDTLFLAKGYKPEYHFLEAEDFTEAINYFAMENEIDIIIAIPKKHGWFEGLFRRNHTKMLAFHSHVPLMIVHD